MAFLAALWLPILLSAVIGFVASSIMHMVLPYHRNDYSQLPDEDKILAELRAAALKRGLYVFPYCTHKDMEVARRDRKQKAWAESLTYQFVVIYKHIIYNSLHSIKYYFTCNNL